MRIIARTPNRANSKSQSSIREKKRIPSNDNCDYTLVVNYLLIIIPNHSDCTFGTIFFFYTNDVTDGKDVRKEDSLHAHFASSHKDLPFAVLLSHFI